MRPGTPQWKGPATVWPTSLSPRIFSRMSGAPAPLVTALADRYRIESELGRGGMATVYLAHDLKHRRSVALKVLSPTAASSLGGERFLREIEVAAGLQHPNIVPVLDSGADAGNLWFTMPFVRGETLRAVLQREGQLPLPRALRIATDAARALEAAHRQGVLHRDVKPENLLLTEDGTTVVADFGIARSTGDAGGLTETGLVVGTPAYMSPEQAAGQRSLDARSDLYSLGCVVYEMLAGEPPYTGHSPQALLAKRLTEPVPPLAPVRDVPPEVERVVTRALARAPADRFGTADELAKALEAASTGESRATAGAGPGATGIVRGITAAVLVAVLAVGGVLVWRLGGAPRAEVPPSVGVLPFTDLSEAGDQGYFSDGLTDELITSLSRVEGVRVAARTSSFQFRGEGIDVREVGRRLGVGTVLEGSVRRSGDRLRVSAQLVSAEDGYQLWASSYDRDAADVFDVQEDIARAIIAALRVTLGSSRSDALAERPTEDLEAYDLYLKGRYAWNLRTPQGMDEAVRHLEQAVERDDDFALAWAALADAYVLQIPYAGASRAETWPKARAAAERALELDPSLGEAHTALAYGSMVYDWDWARAEAGFRQAIEVDPSYPTGHQWYGDFLWSQNRLDEALARMEEAQRLDPLSLVIFAERAVTHYLRREYAEAEQLARELLRLEPNYQLGHYVLGLILLQTERPDEAVTVLSRGLELGGFVQDMAGTLSYAQARAGNLDEALEIRRDLERRLAEGTVGPWVVAIAWLGTHDLDRAFAYLERGVAQRDVYLPEDWMDPLMDPLREDPRFPALAERAGLPQ